jgi:hypothetical protein
MENITEELPDLRFIFCDYLGTQEVVCHRTRNKLNVLVSDKLKNSPVLEIIKNALVK